MSANNSDSDKVALNVMGISYSPMQSGAFTLILAQEDGPIRIPVVIGAAEAQSIRIKLEGLSTPRPMTHDLFCNFASTFGITLESVSIYKFEDGIFSSEMTFTDGEREIVLDSRTSDAVALAVRAGAPIYTTEEILHQAGTVFDEEGNAVPRDREQQPPRPQHTSEHHADANDPQAMSSADLRKLLDKLIEEENYEEAAKISDIIKKREAQ